MAQKFLTNIDLNQNQLLNGSFEVVGTDPSTDLFDGRMIFNSTEGVIKVYDLTAAAWRKMITGVTAAGDHSTAITVNESNGAVTITPNLATSASAGLLSASDFSKLADATSEATANKLVLRDANGQAKFGTPTDPAHAATKSYVDAARSGLDVKDSVRAATTAPINIAADLLAGDTLDTSVTLVAGDRVLVKDQSTASENGIYVVGSPEVVGTTYSVGDVGPAGGYIFITPSTPGNTTGKYFEVALVASEVQRAFSESSYGSTEVTGADGTAIGTGAQNTLDIIAQGNTDPALSAAAYADAYTYGGFSDWFLPSQDEMREVILNKATLGNDFQAPFGPSGPYYGTSTETAGQTSFNKQIDVSNSAQVANANKGQALWIRPVRSFTSASGTPAVAPVRATDFDSNAEVTPGAFTFVEEGTLNADSGWVLTTNGTINVGVTGLTWALFSVAGSIFAGDGLTKTGNTLNVVGTTDRISVSADAVDIASTYVGQSSITTLGTITTGTWNGVDIAVADGGSGSSTASGARTNLADTPASGLTTSTPVLARSSKQGCAASSGGVSTTTVTHNFGTTDVNVQIYEVSTGATVIGDVTRANGNTLSVVLYGTILANDYTIVVVG